MMGLRWRQIDLGEDRRDVLLDRALGDRKGTCASRWTGTLGPQAPGAVAFLPRQLPYAFVITSSESRFLTLHTPAGFDRFVLAAGTTADTAATPFVKSGTCVYFATSAF